MTIFKNSLRRRNVGNTIRASLILIVVITIFAIPLSQTYAQEGQSKREEIVLRLKAAIEEGKITPAQARRIIAIIKAKIQKRRLKAAIEEGKITPAQARRIIAIIKAKIQKRRFKARLRAELAQRIEDGFITREEAAVIMREALIQRKQEVFERRVSTRLRRAVEVGRLSSEEAAAALDRAMGEYEARLSSYLAQNNNN
jgi:phage gp16-like protein